MYGIFVNFVVYYPLIKITIDISNKYRMKAGKISANDFSTKEVATFLDSGQFTIETEL